MPHGIILHARPAGYLANSGAGFGFGNGNLPRFLTDIAQGIIAAFDQLIDLRADIAQEAGFIREVHAHGQIVLRGLGDDVADFDSHGFGGHGHFNFFGIFAENQQGLAHRPQLVAALGFGQVETAVAAGEFRDLCGELFDRGDDAAQHDQEREKNNNETHGSERDYSAPNCLIRCRHLFCHRVLAAACS